NEVLSALRAQNLQVSAGILNQPPAPGDEAYQINVEALGRLSTPQQFADIVLKSDSRGRVTRIGDVGRVEVGAADYGSTSYMDRSNAAALVIYAEPGANTLTVEHEVLATMHELQSVYPRVDDAIVVVENVERNMRSGMSPLEAAHRTMDEVGGALISIALTLCAVFVPSAFLSGISGLFFRQFAVTIAASTVISCFVSLTLS